MSDAFVFLNWYGVAKTQCGFAEKFPSSPCDNVKAFYNNKKLPCGFFFFTQIAKHKFASLPCGDARTPHFPSQAVPAPWRRRNIIFTPRLMFTRVF